MTQLAQLFFNFDRFLGAASIGNGNINDTYRIDYQVEGVQKTALLQRLNHQVFKQPEAVMNNTLRICQHLAKQDYPYQIAAPLPALDGDFLQKDKDGNYWRAFPFIENSFAPAGTSDLHIAYEAARAYGAFARALLYTGSTTEPTLSPGLPRSTRWDAPRCAKARHLPDHWGSPV